MVTEFFVSRKVTDEEILKSFSTIFSVSPKEALIVNDTETMCGVGDDIKLIGCKSKAKGDFPILKMK